MLVVIAECLQAEDDQTRSDKAEIEKYRQENADIRARIKKLKGEAVVFTNTKCAICRGKLELNQVWSLTQFHSLGFSQSRLSVKSFLPASPLGSPVNKLDTLFFLSLGLLPTNELLVGVVCHWPAAEA